MKDLKFIRKHIKSMKDLKFIRRHIKSMKDLKYKRKYIKSTSDHEFKRKNVTPYSIFTCLILCMILAGCQSVESFNRSVSQSTDRELKHYKFAFSCMDGSNPFFVTIQKEIQDIVKANGDEVIFYDPQNDISAQNKQIEQMVEDGVDGLFLNPVSSSGVMPALKDLESTDIPVIGFDTQIEDMAYLKSYVGSDNYNAGFVVGRDMCTRIPDGGSIIVLDAPEIQSATDRTLGFFHAIEELDFNIFAQYNCSGKREKAIRLQKNC